MCVTRPLLSFTNSYVPSSRGENDVCESGIIGILPLPPMSSNSESPSSVTVNTCRARPTIGDLESVLTLVGGEVVYAAGDFARLERKERR